MQTHYIKNLVGAESDNIIVYLPRLWKSNGSRSAIILCGGTNDSWTLGFNENAVLPIARALTAAGYAVGWSDLGINQYANQNAMNRIDALRTYLQSPSIGAKSDKIALAGFSLGGLNAFAYAGNNPTKTLCVTGWCPLVNMQLAVDSIDINPYVTASYGGAWTEAQYGAASNPLTMATAGKYTRIPTEIHYSSNDPVIPQSSITQFISAVNSSDTVSVNAGAYGHSWQAANNQQSIDALLNQLQQASS